MQDDLNRKGAAPNVSQRSHSFSARIGRSQLLVQAQTMAMAALDANPGLPGIRVVDILMQATTPQFREQLAEFLTREFFLRMIRAQWQKRAVANRSQLQLPGFEHLPLTIPDSKGRPVLLMQATFTRVRLYYRSLMIEHRARRNTDPRIREAKALMEMMREYARVDKSITVEGVLSRR
jgi:hypothetical protein